MIIKKHDFFVEGVCFWNEKYRDEKVDLVYYIHDYEKRGIKNFKFYTLIYDLEQSLEKIVSSMKPGRRNYLNVSLRMREIEFFKLENHILTIDEIVETFNSFAEWKGIHKVDLDSISLLQKNNSLETTIVNYKNKPIAAYVYYVDGKTARQWLKVPFINNLNNKILSSISSFHIFNDVKYFKESGYKTYDWGGLYQENQNIEKVKGIIDFKKSFGGKEIQIWKNIDIITQRGQEAFEKKFKNR